MLTTIGYEGARPDDFVRSLCVAGVDLIVDVRDRAQSRRPGFSKSVLQLSLTGAGIGYVHLRDLGDPKAGREAARAGDLKKFVQIYSKVLETEEARAALEWVAEAAQTKTVCLLCYERDPKACHRTLVAERISAITGLKARHLGVAQFEQAQQPARRVRDTRQSVTA